MDLDSPLFDSIRVRPRAEEVHAPGGPRCQHTGCKQTGEFRAPKGRGQEGRFWLFCLEHVRAYNAGYNYFAGLPDDAVSSFQKDAATGHRPTWTMGVNPWSQRREKEAAAARPNVDDQFDLFTDHGFRRARPEPEPERRRLKILERKALETLDLPEAATAAEIKTRYKTWVKRLHPDANGGDRSSEDKLRGIIQAYNTLRSAGLA